MYLRKRAPFLEIGNYKPTMPLVELLENQEHIQTKIGTSAKQKTHAWTFGLLNLIK